MPIEEVVISSPPMGVRELLDLELDQVVEPVIVHSIVVPTGASMTSETTPAATEVWSDRFALVAGAFTLDFENLVGSNLAPFDATGLKVKAFQISCPESNSDGVIYQPGAVDGYDLGISIMVNNLEPGDLQLWVFNDSQPTVNTSNRTLDFTSLGATMLVDILIVFGP